MIEAYTDGKDLVFEANFDYHDLLKMLREDFPDKSEEQIKNTLYYVATTIHPYLLDRIYERLAKL